MVRVFLEWLFLSVVAGTLLCSCGTPLATLFEPQELSENYAVLPGTIAESHWREEVKPVPELVDGDPQTIGTTAREILIVMPEPRAIRRITMRNCNYEDVILYVGGRGEDEWDLVTQVKQNKEPLIEINLSALTDRIRLRIGNTHDDEFGSAEGRLVGAAGGLRRSTFKPGEPKAGEIEIYGLRTKRSDEDALF